jgi:DNA-binding IclR family transcriptional regulator
LRLLHACSDGAWLSIAVQPILNDLANRLAETCYLARLAGHEIVSTAWATPNSGLRGYVVPGYKMTPARHRIGQCYPSVSNAGTDR